jgi:hypothetical protein
MVNPKNNPRGAFDQQRIGYLILVGGDEVPVITARLRDTPLGDWLPADTAEECVAQVARMEQRVMQYALRIHEMKWLSVVAAPLAQEHPDLPLDELIELFSEPNREKARAILHERTGIAIPIMVRRQTDIPQ